MTKPDSTPQGEEALTAAILSRLGEVEFLAESWKATAEAEAEIGNERRDEAVAALARVETLEWHLRECVNQLEYEHGKFGGTGSGETVLSRARSALSEAQPQGDQ